MNEVHQVLRALADEFRGIADKGLALAKGADERFMPTTAKRCRLIAGVYQEAAQRVEEMLPYRNPPVPSVCRTVAGPCGCGGKCPPRKER